MHNHHRTVERRLLVLLFPKIDDSGTCWGSDKQREWRDANGFLVTLRQPRRNRWLSLYFLVTTLCPKDIMPTQDISNTQVRLIHQIDANPLRSHSVPSTATLSPFCWAYDKDGNDEFHSLTVSCWTLWEWEAAFSCLTPNTRREFRRGEKWWMN